MTVRAVFERLGSGFEADGAQIAGGALKNCVKLFGLHGAKFGGAERQQLGFVDLMVAAQESGATPMPGSCPWLQYFGIPTPRLAPCRPRT